MFQQQQWSMFGCGMAGMGAALEDMESFGDPGTGGAPSLPLDPYQDISGDGQVITHGVVGPAMGKSYAPSAPSSPPASHGASVDIGKAISAAFAPSPSSDGGGASGIGGRISSGGSGGNWGGAPLMALAVVGGLLLLGSGARGRGYGRRRYYRRPRRRR